MIKLSSGGCVDVDTLPDECSHFCTKHYFHIVLVQILGMFIFGGKMTYEETDEYGTYKVTSRKNFDTLLWALVTIFQVCSGLV